VLTYDEQSLIARCGTAWGCDICQDVCPHNRDIELTDIDEFRDDLINVLEIDGSISNKEFGRKYGNRAFAWRGKAPVIRNLKILSESRCKTI
jgi:epoxyqueuosine reductase QueG